MHCSSSIGDPHKGNAISLAAMFFWATVDCSVAFAKTAKFRGAPIGLYKTFPLGVAKDSGACERQINKKFQGTSIRGYANAGPDYGPPGTV